MIDFTESYDAFIDVTASEKPSDLVSIQDGEAIFEEYERVRRAELFGSMLMTHLTTMPRESPKPDKDGYIPETTASDTLLSPDGFVAYNGSLPVYDIELSETKNNKQLFRETRKMSVMTKIAKEVTMKQGLDMSCDRQDEDIVW